MNEVSLRSRPLAALAAGLLLMTVATVAHAQATRTWVSGVGSDSNPCSRTAPCKTFAGAIAMTAAGGEINVLDPGGFGAVTITKSITISSESSEGGVLVSGTNGIVVSAGATDTVVIRGLDLEGLGTGLAGINFLAGGTLIVEKCTINNFINAGIDVTASNSIVSVKDSMIRNNSNAANLGGIRIHPQAGTSTAWVDNVRLERNVIGLRGENGAVIIERNSAMFKNTNNGVVLTGTADVTLDNCAVVGNVNGAAVLGGSLKTTNSSYYKNSSLNISGAFTSLGGNHSDGGTPPAGVF